MCGGSERMGQIMLHKSYWSGDEIWTCNSSLSSYFDLFIYIGVFNCTLFLSYHRINHRHLSLSYYSNIPLYSLCTAQYSIYYASGIQTF